MKPNFNKAEFRGAGRLQQRGVALVITLLMLSIITFMAVTFLVLSQRERSSVSTTTDMKIARNASDTALARVSAELLTHMLVHTNFQDFDLMVSTNYINNAGFVDGLVNPTNVNYDHEINNVSFTGGAVEWERNIANLLYNPRAPVFVTTNRGTGAGEFRFYYDVNRNGRYDANGNWPYLINTNNNFYYLTTNAGGYVAVATNYSGWVVSNSFVGDPEWIGVLEHPDQMHSADNRFIGRYAYLVVPVGKTLDINYMHNEAIKTFQAVPGGVDGYMRNQGTGPWEENLAAFLVDLNTNEWDQFPTSPQNYYEYNEGDPTSLQFGQPNKGIAFDDARAMISYRYANNYGTLASANALFPPSGLASIASDGIDHYSDGPLMLGTSTNAGDVTSANWAGADNTNHFFSPQDFFDPAKTSPGFVSRLKAAGTSNDTYNAYTFDRLLASLGTDSAADQGKININYKNTDASGNVIPGMETNMIPWTPIDFFTTAANAMFRQLNLRDFNGNLVTTTNIPIYETNSAGFVVNYYTPEVHRILQLAANMYDATTTRFINGGPTNYPSVFRPEFASQNGVVYIAGYLEVTNSQDAFNFFVDPQAFSTVNNPIRDNINMYGVPWVIGVKKGFPNFNEISMDNPLTVSRKLQFTNSTAMPPWTTNQVFDLSITNSYGTEFWNSYTNAYGRPLRLVVTNEVSVVVSNEFGVPFVSAQSRIFGNDVTFPFWSPWTLRQSDNSMKVPLFVSEVYTNGIYLHQSPWIVPLAPPQWDAINVPQVWMALQFRFRAWLIDTSVNRVIDFVNIVDNQPQINVSGELARGATDNSDLGNPANLWSTKAYGGQAGNALIGIMNQIFVSEGNLRAPDWNDPAAAQAGETKDFRKWINNGGTNNFQAPYTPKRTVSDRISLQANDPLVHYTLDDLTGTNGALATHNTVDENPPPKPLDNLTNLNLAYQPWGGTHTPGSAQSLNPNPQFDNNWQVKDPGIQQSDDWDFPTNKLPNVGWMGRIHRGTPWQTIYMKPANIPADQWRKWNNDKEIITNGAVVTVDAALNHPTADYGLFDLFTTAINGNSSRSRLDINQTNLAAWSAILSGVNILTNGMNGVIGPAVIPPAGVYDSANPSAVARIVQGINETRANTFSNNLVAFPNHTFQHLGDILATPELTVASPFLTNAAPYNVTNGNGGPSDVGANGINDEVMERIPQQIMSLLTLNQTPRFVIYSFGQTLHPADHSLVIGGALNGLCTNYQITAESATRAVVRVEGTADPRYVNGKVDTLGRSYPPHIVVEQFNVLGPD